MFPDCLVKYNVYIFMNFLRDKNIHNLIIILNMQATLNQNPNKTFLFNTRLLQENTAFPSNKDSVKMLILKPIQTKFSIYTKFFLTDKNNKK